MNLSLGRIKGIKIQVHFTFWFIVIWGAFRYGSGNDLSGLLYGAFLTLLIFSIVLLHELGHSLAALRFNIPVQDITLLPFGGLARLKRMPDTPFQEFVVAVAGPAVNVFLAVAMWPVLRLLTDGYTSWRWVFGQAMSETSLLGLVAYLFMINLSLLIFNMIPAFPLDGGRVFRALLAMVVGNEKATRVAVWVGRGFAMALGIYGLMTLNFILAFIAFFIFTAGSAEGRAVALQGALRGIRVRQILSRVGGASLPPDFSMLEAAPLTLHSHQNHFPVMWGDALLGVIRRRDIRQALERGLGSATVSEMMERNVPEIQLDTPLMEAQEQLFRANNHVAAVYEDHQFIGLLGFEEIERALYTFIGRGAVPQASLGLKI